MAHAIRTVTDKTEFQELFYKYFLNGNVALKTSNGNFAIKFLGYSESEVAFRIPYVKNMPSTCLVLTRGSDATIYAELKYKDKQEDEVFTFYPMRMQLIFAQRSGERKVIDNSNEKNIVFVTNMISDFILEKSIALELRKVDRIKFAITGEIEQMFPHKKIYFINEGMSDPRMRYFYDLGSPFIIPDVRKHSDIPEFRSYVENIYSKDYFLTNRKNLVSEVSVPILYKNAVPYGYIQVNSTVQAHDSTLVMLQKLALITSELFRRNGVFQEMEDRLLVSDLSDKGLSIVFRDRKYIRCFKEKSYFNFDLHAGNSVIGMMGVVRNMSLLENKIIKIGCEILKIDPKNQEAYRSFLAI